MKFVIAIITIAILLSVFAFTRFYHFTKELDSHMTESYENEN